jgi:hypothetical protein
MKTPKFSLNDGWIGVGSGLPGTGRLVVDLLDLDILAADGPADRDVTLTGMLAQGNFLDHVRLLGNDGLFRNGVEFDRALVERLIGFVGAQGPVGAGTLNVDGLLRSVTVS